MQNADITLQELDSVVHVDALQRVLENAPRYSLNVSGTLQTKSAAADVFSALPDDFERSKKVVYGIYLGDQLAGCIDVLRGFPSDDTAMIGLLLLDEIYKGKGLGKIVYEHLQAIIFEWSEIIRIRISVVGTNDEVLGFWKKMGFKETGARRPYENGSIRSEAIILEKPTASASAAPEPGGR